MKKVLHESTGNSQRQRNPFSPKKMDWTLEDYMVEKFVLLRKHAPAAEESIPHLYSQERKRPTLVQRRLSRTQALFGRVIPGACVPVVWN